MQVYSCKSAEHTELILVLLFIKYCIICSTTLNLRLPTVDVSILYLTDYNNPSLEKFTWNKCKHILGHDIGVRSLRNPQGGRHCTCAPGGPTWGLFSRILALVLARPLCPFAQRLQGMCNILSQSTLTENHPCFAHEKWFLKPIMLIHKPSVIR